MDQKFIFRLPPNCLTKLSKAVFPFLIRTAVVGVEVGRLPILVQRRGGDRSKADHVPDPVWSPGIRMGGPALHFCAYLPALPTSKPSSRYGHYQVSK